MSGKLEMRVWRERGFKDGDSIAWRAQVYVDRAELLSPIGVGPSREQAIADCQARFAAQCAEEAAAEATVEWIPLAKPGVP